MIERFPKHTTYSQSALQKDPPNLRVLCVIPRATFSGRGSILGTKLSTLNLLKTSCEEKNLCRANSVTIYRAMEALQLF